jgi:DNA recombination protein RmuC
MEYTLLFIILGIALGFFIAFFINKNNEKKNQTQLSELDKEKSVLDAKFHQAIEEQNKSENLLKAERENTLKQSAKIATLENENKNLSEKFQSQKTEIENLQKRLTVEFENIANKILKERAAEFSSVNQKNIGEILNPLKEKINSFEKRVEETYDKELRDKLSLKEEVKRLAELNNKISEDANNLTRALKGDVKKQGNWGEVILERVLERSGLTLGQEYEREEVIEGEDGNVQRPDVIIHLPDNKHIIIDSKVSLVAYDNFISESDETAKEKYLKDHIRSLREHVRILSEKKYQQSSNLNSPDFVLMFLPIEASFSVAVQNDTELFAFAWERKIVIVSPTTLLATLRTISSIWKQENQTKNAREIARLSGSLYDKLHGFVEDLEKIKINIDRAGNSYDEAVKKMKTGNGNIFRTAEKIKELGAKATKTLPDSVVEEEE